MMTKPNKAKQIQRLIDAALSNKLGAYKDGACVYSAGKRRCAVGFMFNDAQIEDIKKRGLNANTNVYTLADRIGKDNIEHVTGLSIDELSELQDAHDGYAEMLSSPSLSVRMKAQLVSKLRFMLTWEARK